jgi:hypothetical protein
MRACHWAAALALTAVSFQNGFATEPNETFAGRTILGPSIRSVTDTLTPGFVEAPDTLLGIRNHFDQIYHVDDDSSNVGNGSGSGVIAAPTNSGSIDFSVTGFGDDFFTGDHVYSGQYEVFVDIYDSGNALFESFSEIRTLAPGVVHDFSFNDFEWIGGNYDVNIDNAIGPVTGGDVDFFTFTGLSPGVTFTAETFDPTFMGIDTRLAWFDAAGALVADNDDNEDAPGSLLSKLEGTVPAGGALTFAVSGFDDDDYVGSHIEDDPYELKLTIGGGSTFAADFNGDNMVTGADLASWRSNFGPSATGDADGDNDTDGADFLIWQRELGSGVGGLAAAATLAIPEPGGVLLMALAAALSAMARADRRPRIATSRLDRQSSPFGVRGGTP